MSATPLPVRAAPAWVWLTAGAITLAAALLLVFLDRLWPSLPTHAAWVNLNLQRLESPAGAEPRVVGIGDSKLRFAVLFDRQLTRPDAAAALPVDFVRITRNAARHADLAPALDALCRQPPALLLVQADLLIWRRGLPDSPWSKPLRRWNDNTQSLRAYVSTPMSSSRVENLGLPSDWRLDGARLGTMSRAELVARYRLAIRTWQPTEPAVLQRWDAALACLQRRGTEVVVLPMPRAPFAQAMLPEPMAAHERQRLAQLASRPGWQVWPTPLSFGDRDFHDEAHMNGDAQRRYSAWLRGALRDWLQTRNAGGAGR